MRHRKTISAWRLLLPVAILLVGKQALGGECSLQVLDYAVVNGPGGRSWHRLTIAFPIEYRSVRIDGALLTIVPSVSSADSRATLECAHFEIANDEDIELVPGPSILARRLVRKGVSVPVTFDVTDLVRGAAARGDRTIELVVGALSDAASGEFSLGTLETSNSKAALRVIFQRRFGNRASEIAR